MDKRIVATPIPPDQPDVPPRILRITGASLIIGVAAIVGGSFWPVLGPWLVAVGIIILVITFFSLAVYWRPSFDRQKKDDMRKLYGR